MGEYFFFSPKSGLKKTKPNKPLNICKDQNILEFTQKFQPFLWLPITSPTITTLVICFGLLLWYEHRNC